MSLARTPYPVVVRLDGSTAEIKVKNGTCLVSIEDLDLVCSVAWTLSQNGRATGSIGGKLVLMHRLIVNAPDGYEVDHANGNKSDNRRENLRVCHRWQNQGNVGPKTTNTSGYKGVSLDKEKQKYRARIRINGVRISLGFFDTAEEAASAYEQALVRHKGEFARTMPYSSASRLRFVSMDGGPVAS